MGFDPFDYDKDAPAAQAPPSLLAQLTVEACSLLLQMPLEDAVRWIEQGRKLAEPRAPGGTPSASTMQREV